MDKPRTLLPGRVSGWQNVVRGLECYESSILDAGRQFLSLSVRHARLVSRMKDQRRGPYIRENASDINVAVGHEDRGRIFRRRGYLLQIGKPRLALGGRVRHVNRREHLPDRFIVPSPLSAD